MAYFAFEMLGRGGKEFIFELTDSEKITAARDIVSGKERDEVHVMGRIIKRTVPYNADWSFHLDPGSIRFFDQAIEVCDADPQYVEDHLDEAGGPFLPGNIWCPWASKVTREVTV
ncbi:BP74-related protein [Kitasatospora sp. McL0602]|uniref:BP74-related protein n=1 Tax=Kitasatospora sp. McL0602 TaxID=3439530 RepID=UPI003F8B4C63